MLLSKYERSVLSVLSQSCGGIKVVFVLANEKMRMTLGFVKFAMLLNGMENKRCGKRAFAIFSWEASPKCEKIFMDLIPLQRQS